MSDRKKSSNHVKIRVAASLLMAGSLFSGIVQGQQVITGSSGGAMYELIVPHPWNGQLVLYSHGYLPPGSPIALPSNPLELLAFQAVANQGFAIATSSYDENGWAVKDGAQSTHQLLGLFASRVGKPSRTYLAGLSMGGLVVVDLAESFPGDFDGALSLCGVVGGSGLQFQHYGDGRVLFDYFFPGVLPGDLLHMPNLDFSAGSATYVAVYNSLVQGLGAPGQPTLQFASVANLPGSNPGEIIYSALQLVGAFGAINDMLVRTHGHNFYDNRNTVYTGSANDAALNAGVQRFSSDPDGVNYVAKYFTPTGNLHFPLLTLHTTEDDTVSFSQEAVYGTLAASVGTSNLLVQQSVNRFGHCNFNLNEIENAFQSLILWVNYGIKPPGGVVP